MLAMSGNVPNVTTAIFCSEIQIVLQFKKSRFESYLTVCRGTLYLTKQNIEYCGTMVMVVRRLDIASILYQCIILNQCCSDGSRLVSLLY